MPTGLNASSRGSRARQHTSYSVYGLTLASDYPLGDRLPRGYGEPDLTFTCVSTAPIAPTWQQSTPIYADPQKLRDGTSIIYIYDAGPCHVIRFTRVADFYLWPDKIVCHLTEPAHRHWVEIWLLGIVLAYWLELQGIPALHASAVVINGRAIAFLSSNKGGKSSLAASLMQLGYPLLTDDILPVERHDSSFLGRPGYPQMRMWPDQAEHFAGHADLEQVHPQVSKRRVPVKALTKGAFCGSVRTLGGLYLPERRDTLGIAITTLAPAEALMALIRNAFLAHNVQLPALEAARLRFFAALVRFVPVKRLVYPDGLEHLPAACDAILQDVAGVEARADDASADTCSLSH